MSGPDEKLGNARDVPFFKFCMTSATSANEEKNMEHNEYDMTNEDYFTLSKFYAIDYSFTVGHSDGMNKCTEKQKI